MLSLAARRLALSRPFPRPLLSSCLMSDSASGKAGSASSSDTPPATTEEREGIAFEKYKKLSTSPKHFRRELEMEGVQEKDEKGLYATDVKTKSLMLVKRDEEIDYLLRHPIWSESEVENVSVSHRPPKGFVDHLAYYTVQTMRKSFDLLSGYTVGKSFGTLDERSVVNRCIFLETVAGVPGFAAAMIRHLHSLRRMQRDYGWIHTLLEEAENERMHLMTFLQLRNPGPFFRFCVILTQYSFTAMFSLSYLISPRFCHRFVGYLEEEAVVTYTHILKDLDEGRLPMWQRLPAPELAIKYWQLPSCAMMRDVILAVRADENHHRLVNHTLGSMKVNQKNPFAPGQ